jgi:hypothetical protein
MSVCPRCRSQAPDGQTYCATCGGFLGPGAEMLTAPPPPPPPAPPAAPHYEPPPVQVSAPGAPWAASPPTYMVPAVIVTVMCCLPLGIPAIVFASQVSTKASAGDLAGAQKASRLALIWTVVAAVVGALATLGFVLLSIFAGLASH